MSTAEQKDRRVECAPGAGVISCGADVLARQRGSYDSEALNFGPLHYSVEVATRLTALIEEGVGKRRSRSGFYRYLGPVAATQ